MNDFSMRRRYLAHSCQKSANMTSYIVFMAALTVAVGQDSVYYKCKDFPMSDLSKFEFSCDAGRIIIVKSAIIGATDIFNPPQQCPITSNTCLKETTIAAELCTGRNSCAINQNILLHNESKLSCPRNGSTVGNFINVNYTCIVPGKATFGDICHFEGDFYSNSAVYISSFPNFPDSMGAEVNYQCSCQFMSKSSSSSANVSIRALLVKLTGAATCSERLSIVDSGGETKLAFCSPCNNVNNVTTVPLAANPVILFQRDSFVSPFNGKFLLEITVPSVTSGSGSIGSMKCGFVDSIFSSTNVQHTSSGMTERPSNMSASTQQSILSSSKPASGTQNAASSSSIATPTDGGPTLASQTDSEKKSLSTGAIIGIVLGVIGFLAVLSLVILFATKNLRSKQNGAQSTEVMPSASDPRLDRSSVDRTPAYEIPIEGNGLQVNQSKISKLPNMQGNKDPPDHACYNEPISNITPLPGNHDHYEPLRVTDNQQQTYYNQPSENSNYQPLNFS